MALNVISNFAANVAHRNLQKTDMEATASLAKLSSGARIVQAKDDAASLAIGSRIAAEVGALKQSSVNAGQASSMMQIADGAMARANEIMIRMKTLAVQAASGQISDTERSMLDVEYQSLRNEITRIGSDTEFNGVKMLAGSISVTQTAGFDGDQGVDDVRAFGVNTTASITIGVTTTGSNATFTATDGGSVNYTATLGAALFSGGALISPQSVVLTSTNAQNTGTISIDLNTAFSNTTSIANQTLAVAGSTSTSFTFKVGTGSVAAEDDLTFSIDSLVAVAASLATGVGNRTDAETASAEVSTAIDSLNSARAGVGANQSRLEFAAANLATAIENTEAARSALLDLDVASEMSTFTSKQILLQAGVSMLAQANQIPQNLLQLFQ